MSLTFESIYPWLFGAFASVLAWLLDGRLPSESAVTSLLSAAISVSAILVGFLATVKSILMAMPSVLAQVKASGYLPNLASYITVGITTNLAFCALNLAAFFPWAATWPQSLAVLWMGLAVVAGLSFWRVTRVMSLLLHMV